MLVLDVATKVQKSTFLRQYLDELLPLLKYVGTRAGHDMRRTRLQPVVGARN